MPVSRVRCCSFCSFGLVLAGLALAAATPHVAQAQGTVASPFYVGIGMDFGFEDFDDTQGLDIDEAYGVDAWAGYRFAEFIAAEVDLEYLNGFDVELLGYNISGQAVAFTGNAKLFPFARVLPDRVEPFVYTGIGVGWFEYDTGFGERDDDGFIARFGGGIDFYVTDRLALQASSSYVLPTGDIDDLRYVSLVLGLQYRFGGSQGI